MKRIPTGFEKLEVKMAFFSTQTLQENAFYVSRISCCHFSFSLAPAYVKVFPIVFLQLQTVNYPKL